MTEHPQRCKHPKGCFFLLTDVADEPCLPRGTPPVPAMRSPPPKSGSQQARLNDGISAPSETECTFKGEFMPVIITHKKPLRASAFAGEAAQSHAKLSPTREEKCDRHR